MAKKNRRRPFQCPVTGCYKRGLRADLLRHASVVHPNVSRDAYLSAIVRGVMLGNGAPTRFRLPPFPVRPFSLALSIACILLIVALAVVAKSGLVN